MDSRKQIAQFSAEFNSVEQFNQAMQDWQLEFSQLDGGGYHSQLEVLQTASALLNRVGFDQRILQQGRSPAGMMTFGLRACAGFDAPWGGKLITTDTLEIFNGRDGFELVSPAGFDAFTLALPIEHLAQLAEREQLDIGFNELENREGVIATAPKHSAQLRWLLTAALNDGGDYAESERIAMVEEDAALLILQALADKQQLIAPAKLSARLRALKKARDFIESNAGEALTVTELCEAAHTSKRTLDRAFADYYGISPKSYLMIKRLNGAHRDLVNADGTQQVSDIANRWGFWHMGSFAAEYRGLFGELPRQTLQRS